MEESAKNKSLIISGEIHNKLKRYCKGKSLKINLFVENLILQHLEAKELERVKIK